MRGWIKPERPVLAFLLVLSLLTASCGGGFASSLRTVLAASDPLIQSLVDSGVIRPEQKLTYIRDFQDLAQGAATLSDDLKICAKAKPCSLDAVDRFQHLFWDVERRGRFGISPKLRNVESILQAIITAAKVYYSPPSRVARGSDKDQERAINAKIRELEAAMK